MKKGVGFVVRSTSCFQQLPWSDADPAVGSHGAMTKWSSVAARSIGVCWRRGAAVAAVWWRGVATTRSSDVVTARRSTPIPPPQSSSALSPSSPSPPDLRPPLSCPTSPETTLELLRVMSSTSLPLATRQHESNA
jgi:hypothetical protein